VALSGPAHEGSPEGEHLALFYGTHAAHPGLGTDPAKASETKIGLCLCSQLLRPIRDALKHRLVPEIG
jgi:hypothetical protein